MNGSITITLLRDRVLSRTRPAVDYELDYEYAPTEFVGQPEEKAQTRRGTVRIGITPTVIAMWSLGSDEVVLRVLYQHAKREVERRAREGNLGTDSVIEIENSSAPKECPYEPGRVERIFGKPFEFRAAQKDPISGRKSDLESVNTRQGSGGARTRRIFICHAAEDKAIARILKQYMEQADTRVDVFVASHPESLPGGREWWDEIRDNLKASSVVLTLVSRASKNRPWIYFESGGAFFLGTTVIPVAVPPEAKGLPPPLGVLQGYTIGALEDVRALVAQTASVLGVKFPWSADKLFADLLGAIGEPGSDTTPPQAPPPAGQQDWRKALRVLAERGATILVHPIVPPAFADNVFEIGPIEDTRIGLFKQDSRHRVDVPPYRIIGIRISGDAHVLDIHGRVQWIDAEDSWKYLPEDIDPRDPLGLARDVDMRSAEVQSLTEKLRADGWQVAFQREIKARSRLSRDHQLVYGGDGRHLRVPDRVAPSVMVKYRERR